MSDQARFAADRSHGVATRSSDRWIAVGEEPVKWEVGRVGPRDPAPSRHLGGNRLWVGIVPDSGTIPAQMARARAAHRFWATD